MGAVVYFTKPRCADDGRRCFVLFPQGDVHGSWLYAVGYTDGTVKIGRTCHPRPRIFQHFTASEGTVAWGHLFSRVGDDAAKRIERRALKGAAAFGGRVGRTEFFRGLTRADVMRCVRLAIAEA